VFILYYSYVYYETAPPSHVTIWMMSKFDVLAVTQKQCRP